MMGACPKDLGASVKRLPLAKPGTTGASGQITVVDNKNPRVYTVKLTVLIVESQSRNKDEQQT